ncbi:hypothetical protein FOI42_RS04120 [Escherichia coli]|nr:hypothetical protein [Escherichia coli]EFL4883682.1 hypothetical protein [Escherichia coli]MED6699501.1 hypothetical protein [Escherichia coli O157]USL83618.1 hypothetical protein A4_542 [Escherichia phage A4]HCQ0858493.1 hypothetical protein [Escherichia coli]
MTITVKLLNINNVGPVLAVLQTDAPEAVVVNYPAQLGTDEKGEIILRDYLEFISSEKGVIFFKSNIISISDANPALVDAYVEAIKTLEDKPALIVPDNKIIL